METTKKSGVWIADLNMESGQFEYLPKEVLRSEVEESLDEFFETKEEAQQRCDELNSEAK